MSYHFSLIHPEEGQLACTSLDENNPELAKSIFREDGYTLLDCTIEMTEVQSEN